MDLDIGVRLREERERLRMTQTAMAAIGGKQKLAQLKYEQGESSPSGSYLAAIAAVGVDVLYVLTGQRSGGVAPTPVTPANPRQAALLDNYEAADEQGKKIIEATAFAAAKPAKPVKKGGKAA